ncbi:hypothetical protein IAT38_004630 [Cryptococcus sp. DSM 104549]
MPGTPTHESDSDSGSTSAVDDDSRTTSAGAPDATFAGLPSRDGTASSSTFNSEAANQQTLYGELADEQAEIEDLLSQLRSLEPNEFVCPNEVYSDGSVFAVGGPGPQHDEFVVIPCTAISNDTASRFGFYPTTGPNAGTATHPTEWHDDPADPGRRDRRALLARLQLLAAAASFVSTAHLAYSHHNSTAQNVSLRNDLASSQQQVERLREEMRELRSWCPAGSGGNGAGAVEGNEPGTIVIRRTVGGSELGGGAASEEGQSTTDERRIAPKTSMRA